MVCKCSAKVYRRSFEARFNPCYVGLWSVRGLICKRSLENFSFNPCYVGLWSVRWAGRVGGGYREIVSILVMLDYGL